MKSVFVSDEIYIIIGDVHTPVQKADLLPQHSIRSAATAPSSKYNAGKHKITFIWQVN